MRKHNQQPTTTTSTTPNPTLSSASDPSKLKTAYLFLSFLPSSLDAGRIMARYGPSTSKKMEFSLRVLEDGEYYCVTFNVKKMEFSLRVSSYNQSEHQYNNAQIVSQIWKKEWKKSRCYGLFPIMKEQSIDTFDSIQLSHCLTKMSHGGSK